jgi:hypothetical protein
VTALEDRLRSELRAESETITPGSIASLRLPEQPASPRGPLRGGARQWPAWVRPAVAAAAITVVIAGTFAVARLFPGVPPAAHTPGDTQAPPYYAYTVDGYIYRYNAHGTEYGEEVFGRYLKVRATATGKLLATISPPKPYNEFTTITADAAADTFVLGAAARFEHTAHPSRQVLRRDRRTPMRFFLLRITPGGHTRLAALSLPAPPLPGQSPSIALSPDGTRLAVAFGGRGQPAVVRVIGLATGQQRQWAWRPRTPWTPLLLQEAWTANGRTLAIEQSTIPLGQLVPAGTGGRAPAATRVRLLDTAAPGPSLAAASRLVVLRAPAGDSAPSWPILTLDGGELIGPVTRQPGGLRWLRTSTGAFAGYSAGTGRLLRTRGAWAWSLTTRTGHGAVASPVIAWSDGSGRRLVVLLPRHDRNVLGVLTGNSFTTAGGQVLRQRPQGYQELEYALRTGTLMAW